LVVRSFVPCTLISFFRSPPFITILDGVAIIIFGVRQHRGPRLNVMGGPDGGLIGDAMGGPDRGPRLNVMGGPDRGPRLNVMGGPDPVPCLDAGTEIALRPAAPPFTAAKRYSRRALTRAAS
jgi:hypothetical protein